MERELWEKIEELYNAALKLAPELRAGFLAKATAGNAPLKAEVESLLQSREKRGDFLDTPLQSVECPLECQREAESLIEEPSMHRIVHQVVSNMALSDKPALTIGETYSHYRIVDKLGQGGMGEVYRARDLALGRDVAIKLLPEEFARNANRIARFQREAKLLAALNHPNIAAIYGLVESGGINFLVLELAEGETLGDRLKRGPIAVEESLNMALQIAEALEAAHQKGVIHRDLKPANIKITPEGTLKLLDFSVAKAFAEGQADRKPADSQALNAADTRLGVIMGTAAYMSPEQARGRVVDKRTDIWAFGCVLFEMLTGQPAFKGDNVDEILAAVIRSEPEWGRLPVNLHGRLREILERCLKKELRNRYHDISDVRLDAQRALTNPYNILPHPVTTAESRTRLGALLPWVAVAIVLSLIIGGAAVWILKPTGPRQVVRFDYALPEGQQFSDLMFAALAISPDGKQFVYSTTKGLYLRAVDELNAKPISGTEGNTQQPLFSPDGKWIGYYSVSDQKWKKIAINGGAPVALGDATSSLNASWGADDTIVYSEFGKGTMRVSANGGTPELIVRQIGNLLTDPQILPDGKTVLFGIFKELDTNQIAIQSLKSGEHKVLIEGANGHYLPTGYLVYAVKDGFFAAPFDLGRLEIKGGPVPLIESVFRLEGVYTPQYAVSDSGTLVYIPATMGAQRTLVWVDRNGKEEPLSIPTNPYYGPRISPDGTKVAFSVGGNIWNGDIGIWDLIHKNMTWLTLDTGGSPIWTPDGKQIVYESVRENICKLYRRAADGTGKADLIGSASGRDIFPSSWSDNGTNLLLTELNLSAGGIYNIGMLSMQGDGKRRSLLEAKHNEMQPRISPDGKWMAYTSNESGRKQIYVRPFPVLDGRGRWQVSTGGGDSAIWSRDGRELFYRNGDAVMAVSVRTKPSLILEMPKTLFHGTYVYSDLTSVNSHLSSWDISPDGKRFLILKESPAASASGGARRINIALNWLEELKNRAPAKRSESR